MTWEVETAGDIVTDWQDTHPMMTMRVYQTGNRLHLTEPVFAFCSAMFNYEYGLDIGERGAYRVRMTSGGIFCVAEITREYLSAEPEFCSYDDLIKAGRYACERLPKMTEDLGEPAELLEQELVNPLRDFLT